MTRISGIRSATVNGFTLVELVAIIVLVALLAFTAMPRLPGPSLDVDSQAEQLAAEIRYTQSLSMTRGDRYRINLTSASYQITDSGGVNPEVHPGTSSTNPVLLDGVALSGYNPPLTNNYVAFDGRGMPYTDVTGTALSANATITLNGGGATRTVVISPETGRVVLQ
jgi:type II secretory pathway pseudopilin PulG